MAWKVVAYPLGGGYRAYAVDDELGHEPPNATPQAAVEVLREKLIGALTATTFNRWLMVPAEPCDDPNAPTVAYERF